MELPNLAPLHDGAWALAHGPAVMGTHGAKLPLIGKADIGRSAEGFLRLIQEALGPRRKQEAIFTSLQIAPGFEFNPFDLQVGCERPLPLEKIFCRTSLLWRHCRPTNRRRSRA